VPSVGYRTDGLPTCGYFPAVFSLSSSGTDPYQVTGPLTEPLLYLWVNAADAGYGFLEGYAHLEGDLQVLAFTPERDNVTWNPDTHEFHAAFCSYAAELLGTILVNDPTPIEASSWARIKALSR